MGGRLRQSVPLAPLTTLGIGGPARLFFEATSEEDVARATAHADQAKLELLVLGGGSNLLVADRGFDGLALQVSIAGVTSEPLDGDRVLVTAGAGESWDGLVEWAVARDLEGLECLSGIPGRVGATPIQNVGAYGQEVSRTIVSVRAWDRIANRAVELGRDDCGFAYRTSCFKIDASRRHVIVAVTFEVRSGGEPCVRYPELVRALAERGATRPGLKTVRETVLALRRSKSMVIDPADPDSRSAGSFFLNPILDSDSAACATQSGRSAGILGPDEAPPCFDAGHGKVKLPAAWLIERSGLSKGQALGRAGISRNHPLSLVNRGGATAGEMLDLARLVRARVREVFGVTLEVEPTLVGFEPGAF
ncbi:MAG: UDP-N-acetylmuramate dehydrogenase [Deltaproteobacteria bacterium]|nr:UDP-N-acetylmuramate dehydrogenase [Deltaproteobacteria bacterium]